MPRSALSAVHSPVFAAGLIAAGSALAADDRRAYGEYLAGECVTCHHAAGEDKGIPNIVGMRRGHFIRLMRIYRSKKRPNPTMQTIAASLDDEQIAALAAYFSTLRKTE
jgi:cytochrome c